MKRNSGSIPNVLWNYIKHNDKYIIEKVINMKTASSRLGLAVALSLAGSSAALAGTEPVAPENTTARNMMVAQAEAVDDLQKYESMYQNEMMDAETMQMLDVNADGIISREEFMHVHEAIFDMADKNKDEKLEEDEMGKGSLPEMKTG